MKTKSTFETVDAEGKKLFLAVVKPNAYQMNEAKCIFSKTKVRLLENHEAVPRSRIFDMMREHGVWDDEKEKSLREIDQEISRLEKLLAKGKKAELSEKEKAFVDEKGWLEFGKHLAMSLKLERFNQFALLVNVSQFDDITVESIAEAKSLDYLVSKCTVYGKNEGRETLLGTPYFKSDEDYFERKDEEASARARMELTNLTDDSDPDYLKKLPENQFLLKYKFVNDELNFVDKDGHLTDAAGRRIDKDGNYLDEKGNPIIEETGVGDFE